MRSFANQAPFQGGASTASDGLRAACAHPRRLFQDSRGICLCPAARSNQRPGCRMPACRNSRLIANFGEQGLKHRLEHLRKSTQQRLSPDGKDCLVPTFFAARAPSAFNSHRDNTRVRLKPAAGRSPTVTACTAIHQRSSTWRPSDRPRPASKTRRSVRSLWTWWPGSRWTTTSTG